MFKPILIVFLFITCLVVVVGSYVKYDQKQAMENLANIEKCNDSIFYKWLIERNSLKPDYSVCNNKHWTLDNNDRHI